MSKLHDVLTKAIESWPNHPWRILPGPVSMAPDLVAHLEKALTESEMALVELPDLDGIKRQHISFGPEVDCENDCCPGWVEDDDNEVSYSPDEARDLAAALLSAANGAEGYGPSTQPE